MVFSAWLAPLLLVLSDAHGLGDATKRHLRERDRERPGVRCPFSFASLVSGGAALLRLPPETTLWPLQPRSRPGRSGPALLCVCTLKRFCTAHPPLRGPVQPPRGTSLTGFCDLPRVPRSPCSHGGLTGDPGGSLCVSPQLPGIGTSAALLGAHRPVVPGPGVPCSSTHQNVGGAGAHVRAAGGLYQ